MTTQEALSRAMKICSTKEYAPSEIEQKLYSWGLTESGAARVMETLINEKFLDEYRMSRYYVNDKLKFNKWGKTKIRFMLQQKKISKEAINDALDRVNEDEYLAILMDEIQKKRKTIKATDDYQIRGKLFQFAIGRGFETEVINRVLDKLL